MTKIKIIRGNNPSEVESKFNEFFSNDSMQIISVNTLTSAMTVFIITITYNE